MLDSVYGELRDEGASEHKIQKVHRLLSAAFNRAVRYGWMVANPCLQATKPKVDSEEIEPPSPEWVRKLIAAAEAVNEDLRRVPPPRRGDRRPSGRRGGDPVGRLHGQPVDDPPVARRVRGSAVRTPDEDGLEGVTGRSRWTRRRCGRSTRFAAPARRRRARAARAGLRVLLRRRRHALATRLPVARLRPAVQARVPAARPAPLPRHPAPRRRRPGDDREQAARPHQHRVTLNTYGHWLPEQDRDAADIIGRLFD